PTLICMHCATTRTQQVFLSITTLSTNLPPVSFFFTDTSPTEIYTLSLHDALPIYCQCVKTGCFWLTPVQLIEEHCQLRTGNGYLDRKSTRLNSSHVSISYAVFCLKK